MEEPPEPLVEAPFSFPAHRRSHLRSGTYRNLVRLISLCYGDSPLGNAPPIIPLHRTSEDNGSNHGEPGGGDARELDESIVPDNGSNQGEPAGDDVRERGDSIVPDNMAAQEGKVVDGGIEAAIFKGREFSDTQIIVDEIGQMMQIEEGQDFINQSDPMVLGSTEGIDFQDGEIGRQQMLMNELENVMKGNQDRDNSNNCLATLLDRNQGDNCLGESMNHQEGPIDFPLVGKESGMAGQTQVDMDNVNQRIIEAFGFSSDEVSKPSEEVENQSSSLKTSAMHEKIENQQKDMELEKFVCSDDRISSPGQMVEDEELEEGEIFGDVQLVNESIDMLLEDALVLEKKEEEKLVSGGGLDNKHLRSIEASTANDQDSKTAPIADGVTEADPEVNESGQIVSKLEKMHTNKGSAKILKQSESENRVIKSKQKKDVGVCDKKKQGPSIADKKEKKKKNKRKRRAEKNKQLGVKRLKLKTVLKPKTVAYCRHYLKGRCYEGEKCKYSHDTVPLTKSQPCCHFARQSCMKGDDCPFDHQLSKYPCTSYVTKGFCPRGDDCLFSHKISPEGDVASLSNDRELQLKPSLQVDSNMRINMSRNVEASSCSAVAFSQRTEQIVAETPTKTPDPARKGVNCLFLSKSSMAQPRKLNQGGSSQKITEKGRVGIQSNQNSLVVNGPFASKPSLAESDKFGEGSSSLKVSKGIQANQSESGTIKNVNDSPKRKTDVVPRGINFLSFRKSSLGDSASKASLALNRGDGHKQQCSDNNLSTQKMSSTDQRIAHPAGVRLRMDFLSMGKSGNSTSNEASILSSSEMVKNGSIQKSTYAADKQHHPSAMSYKLPVSTQTSGQSSELSLHTNRPNSAQKVLISTPEGAERFGNINSGSAHESQYFCDKQCNSNPNPFRIPAYQLPKGQSSEMSHKNTPTSAPKALMSTLAFAAKFESGLKKNQSTVTTGVNSETSSSRMNEGSRIDSEKTSKILEFLSSVGSKIKQI